MVGLPGEAKSLISDVCIGLSWTVRSPYYIEKFLQTLQTKCFPDFFWGDKIETPSTKDITVHALKTNISPKNWWLEHGSFSMKMGGFSENAMLVYRIPSHFPLILTSALKVGWTEQTFFTAQPPRIPVATRIITFNFRRPGIPMNLETSRRGHIPRRQIMH